MLFETALDPGTYEFSYQIRASLPGEYLTLPPTASQMYFPDVEYIKIRLASHQPTAKPDDRWHWTNSWRSSRRAKGRETSCAMSVLALNNSFKSTPLRGAAQS